MPPALRDSSEKGVVGAPVAGSTIAATSASASMPSGTSTSQDPNVGSAGGGVGMAVIGPSRQREPHHGQKRRRNVPELGQGIDTFEGHVSGQHLQQHDAERV